MYKLINEKSDVLKLTGIATAKKGGGGGGC